MSNTVEILKDINDLEQECFRFSFSERDCILILDNYIKANRESKKHKFKPILKYDRMMKSVCTIKDFEIPLTEEIRAQAFNKFISRIRVMTSGEWEKLQVRKMIV